MDLRISLVHGSEAEIMTRAQLQRLRQRYGVLPFEFTDEAVIDETAIPHSHPVLTLHTRHRDDDLLLLSTYLHEQLHWFLTQQPDDRLEPVLAALTARYPNPPIGFPAGSDSSLGDYFHYLICRLEYLCLRHLAGEDAAERAIAFWQLDHYTEIYRTVMEDGEFLDALLREHDLMLPTSDTASREGE
ncbi:MAG TPA: hypothetical protein VFB58_13910 [Chloroflexota bacterium]|nr:hypothetical protein [Chloroflexota bacterium]